MVDKLQNFVSYIRRNNTLIKFYFYNHFTKRYNCLSCKNPKKMRSINYLSAKMYSLLPNKIKRKKNYKNMLKVLENKEKSYIHI